VYTGPGTARKACSRCAQKKVPCSLNKDGRSGRAKTARVVSETEVVESGDESDESEFHPPDHWSEIVPATPMQYLQMESIRAVERLGRDISKMTEEMARAMDTMDEALEVMRQAREAVPPEPVARAKRSRSEKEVSGPRKMRKASSQLTTGRSESEVVSPQDAPMSSAE
jgi:hypothetical protein